MGMATGWLLLLLIASSQSVYSQPTTDDQVCDGQHLNEMKRDIQMLLDNQKQLYHHLGKSSSKIRCVATMYSVYQSTSNDSFSSNSNCLITVILWANVPSQDGLIFNLTFCLRWDYRRNRVLLWKHWVRRSHATVLRSMSPVSVQTVSTWCTAAQDDVQ